MKHKPGIWHEYNGTVRTTVEWRDGVRRVIETRSGAMAGGVPAHVVTRTGGRGSLPPPPVDTAGPVLSRLRRLGLVR